MSKEHGRIVARIEEQYSLAGRGVGRLEDQRRIGYDVIRKELGIASIYAALKKDGSEENSVTVARMARGLVDLSIERQDANRGVTAALTHLALLEYVKAWEGTNQGDRKPQVISFIQLSDNPEADPPIHPLYGETLGMEGQSIFTENDEVVYVGDLEEVHGNAMHAVSRGVNPPYTIRPTIPFQES